MDLENLSLEEKAKFKRYILVIIAILVLILGVIGFFVGKSLLSNSYDTKQEFINIMVESEITDGPGSSVFKGEDIEKLDFGSLDLINMSKEDRYTVDMYSVTTKHIWDSFGKPLSLEGCEYEIGSSGIDILYRIYGTSIGDIYVRCGSIIGDIKQIYKEGSFSTEDKELLDSIDSYNEYYQDNDCEVVVIGGMKGRIKDEETN